MRLTIDTEKADKDIGVDGLLYLTALYLGCNINEDTFKKLNNKGLIIKDVNRVLPTKDSNEIVENAYGDMEISNKLIDERFNHLAESLRELFPLGRKDGTQLQWRDSSSIISKRLKAFIKKFDIKENTYTDEQYIEATRRYVNSFNGNYQYMQVLKYFIMKNKIEDGMSVINSQLLSYLENTEDSSYNNDWNCELV